METGAKFLIVTSYSDGPHVRECTCRAGKGCVSYPVEFSVMSELAIAHSDSHFFMLILSCGFIKCASGKRRLRSLSTKNVHIDSGIFFCV